MLQGSSSYLNLVHSWVSGYPKWKVLLNEKRKDGVPIFITLCQKSFTWGKNCVTEKCSLNLFKVVYRTLPVGTNLLSFKPFHVKQGIKWNDVYFSWYVRWIK